MPESLPASTYKGNTGKERPISQESSAECTKRKELFRSILPFIRAELQKEGIIDFKVVIVGSTANDAASPTSDLDIVVSNISSSLKNSHEVRGRIHEVFQAAWENVAPSVTLDIFFNCEILAASLAFRSLVEQAKKR